MRLVRPEHAANVAVRIAQRDDEPVVVPRMWATPIHHGAIHELARADACRALLAGNQIAAGDLELRLEQP
jgi:hypothetical protein